MKLRRTNQATGRKRPENCRRMWSGQVLGKYWAMQLLETVTLIVVLFALEDAFGWPRWIVWTIVAGSVAKNVMLYPFVWRSYDPAYPSALPHRMEGAKGVALDRVDPTGLVRVSGELWRAELQDGARQIEAGEAVRVKVRRGMTLLVEPEESG